MLTLQEVCTNHKELNVLVVEDPILTIGLGASANLAEPVIKPSPGKHEE